MRFRLQNIKYYSLRNSSTGCYAEYTSTIGARGGDVEYVIKESRQQVVFDSQGLAQFFEAVVSLGLASNLDNYDLVCYSMQEARTSHTIERLLSAASEKLVIRRLKNGN